MKHYLLLIEATDEPTWYRFAKTYRKKGLGPNLSIAILTLIKHYNRGDL